MEKKLSIYSKLLILKMRRLIFRYQPHTRRAYSITHDYKMMLFLLLIAPHILIGQIENQVRDDNPGLFKNQRLYHTPPKPLFKGRSHDLDFITNIPDDSVLTATLFFKTNFMAYYQEFSLKGNQGLYQFTYEPETYPGTHLQYYFVIETDKNIHGCPINDQGELTPVDNLLIDPIQYFKQQSRLNR